MLISTIKRYALVVGATLVMASSATAATIDFGSGTMVSSTKTYTEDGFQFVPASIDNANGGVNGNSCPFISPNVGDPPCLKITGGGNGNSKFSLVTMTHLDGNFDLVDFLFEFTGVPDNGD